MVFIGTVAVLSISLYILFANRNDERKDIASGSLSSPTVQSNTWFSTIYRDFPTQPLFAMPLSYRLTKQGIEVGMPQVVPQESTVFASHLSDVTIGVPDGMFNSVRLDAIGDWHIDLSLTSQTEDELSFFLGRGMPYLNIKSSSQAFLLTFPDGYSVLDSSDNRLIVETRGNKYMMTTLGGSFDQSIDTIVTVVDASSLFFVYLTEESEKDIFDDMTNLVVEDTRVTYEVSDNQVISTFTIEHNLKDTRIPFAVYPHHSNNVVSNVAVDATYSTLRGNLELIRANEFSTQLDLSIPNKTFYPLQSQENIENLQQYLQNEANSILTVEPLPTSKNYFFGTWIGRVVSVIQLAEAHSLQAEATRLREFVKPLFLEALEAHTYNEETNSFVSTQPEFGNDTELNDHHFHYGYFIRAAYVLGEKDSQFLEQIRTTIQEMVDDIMTTERDSERYPFLRNYDIYEGHSWASGYMPFTDGNNQESTSEAIQAWYATYLWSTLIGDEDLKTYSLALYRSELESTRYYWFDVNTIYQDPYRHEIASIVWGGKVDFTTWFSGEANMIYGIQLLPFTPVSDYLGAFEDFEQYSQDVLVSGGGANKPWGDLYLMWQSFYNPEETIAQAEQVPDFEGSKSESLFWYVLLRNKEESEGSVNSEQQ